MTPALRECQRCGQPRRPDCYETLVRPSGLVYTRKVCCVCRKIAESRRTRDQRAYFRERRATLLGQLLARKYKARERVAYWQEVEAEMDRKIAELKG